MIEHRRPDCEVRALVKTHCKSTTTRPRSRGSWSNSPGPAPYRPAQSAERFRAGAEHLLGNGDQFAL